MTQIDRLIRAIREMNNPSVMGLDTKVDYLPEAFAKRHIAESGRAGAILAYNKALMEGLRDVIPAVKIQSAYYELLGSEGIRCMEQTIEIAHKLDYVVMVDAKRGDIGATATAYSAAYLAPD
ncbi:orotidine 5'-phosphate decarboxylase, partial [Synergistaceae bacterium OttesenSCG-928-I11]|nr:orotidine 5'-phosphate decarboxylase [Synergistaceae bacterium OttesenSCG-928-I11]